MCVSPPKPALLRLLLHARSELTSGHLLLFCSAAPNTGQIKRGLQLAANSKGTLIVIMRYTGDVLHFGLAKEQTAAQTGQNLRLLAVGDDVAVGREQGKSASPFPPSNFTPSPSASDGR